MKSIFKTFLLLSVLAAPVAYAQTAAILPPAKTTFFDANGNPLTSGTVTFYIPGTSTLKTTYQDAAQTIPNANPVVLDAAGRALILGSGSYRQVVKDRNNNQMWDQVTSSVGSGGGGGSTVGDGNPVGAILPFSGIVAPANYAFPYGQELSRTTYASLFTATTQSQAVTCGSGLPTLTSVADTSQISIGGKIEASCLPVPGTVISKTASTVVTNQNALVTTTVTATFFTYGNGNGTTTFNVPDLRGVVLPGRCNMGGAACSVITNPTYTDPNSLNGSGGSQTTTLITANLPAYTPSGAVNITDPGHTHPYTNNNGGNALSNVNPGGNASAAVTTASTTGITAAFVGVAQGGSSTPIRTVQPSRTINYILKVLPDVNLSVARCEDISNAGPLCSATVAPVVNGGTGSTTAQAARAALNVDGATATGDANYAILATDRMVYHTALSAARTDTLPLAATTNVGQILVVSDFRGVASAVNTITLQRSGADTINGATTTVAIATQFGAGILWSDGVSRWTFLPAGGGGGGGGGTVTNVTCGDGLNGGSFSVSGTCSLNPTYISGYIQGLTITNDATSDIVNEIAVASGIANDSLNSNVMVLSSAISRKKINVSWAVGANQGCLDTGAVANGTYHIFLIKRTDTGVVDILCSTSAIAPTMPASYTIKRRIGSILRASAAIVLFVQDGNNFSRSVPISDLAPTTPASTSAITRTLSVPVGIRVKWTGMCTLNVTAVNTAFLVTDLAIADTVPSSAINSCFTVPISPGVANNLTTSQLSVFTNTSAQVRSRSTQNDAAVFVSLTTFGWVDTRDQ